MESLVPLAPPAPPTCFHRASPRRTLLERYEMSILAAESEGKGDFRTGTAAPGHFRVLRLSARPQQRRSIQRTDDEGPGFLAVGFWSRTCWDRVMAVLKEAACDGPVTLST